MQGFEKGNLTCHNTFFSKSLLIVSLACNISLVVTSPAIHLDAKLDISSEGWNGLIQLSITCLTLCTSCSSCAIPERDSSLWVVVGVGSHVILLHLSIIQLVHVLSLAVSESNYISFLQSYLQSAQLFDQQLPWKNRDESFSERLNNPEIGAGGPVDVYLEGSACNSSTQTNTLINLCGHRQTSMALGLVHKRGGVASHPL